MLFVVYSAVLLKLLIRCGHSKKESAYGPGNEWVNDMRDQIQKRMDDPDKVKRLLSLVDKRSKSYYSGLDGPPAL